MSCSTTSRSTSWCLQSSTQATRSRNGAALILVVSCFSSNAPPRRDRNGCINEQSTEPNSLLVIKAGAVEHRVTPIKRGERHIIKTVYVAEGAEKLPAFEVRPTPPFCAGSSTLRTLEVHRMDLFAQRHQPLLPRRFYVG